MRSAHICNCSIAAARNVSAAPRMTRLPSFLNRVASFALVDREIGSHRLLDLLDDLGVSHEEAAFEFLEKRFFVHRLAIARFTISSSIVIESAAPPAGSNSRLRMTRR